MEIVTGELKEKRPVEFKLGSCVRNKDSGQVYICAGGFSGFSLINLSSGGRRSTHPTCPFGGHPESFENVEAHVVVED